MDFSYAVAELLRSSGSSDRAYGGIENGRGLEVVADEDEGRPVEGMNEGVRGDVAGHVGANGTAGLGWGWVEEGGGLGGDRAYIF